MRDFQLILCTICFAAILSGASFCAATEPVAAPAAIEFFEKKVRPLLHKHCFECHASDSATLQGGLLLDSASGLHAGGDSGAAVIAGKPAESLLIEAVEYGPDSMQMPPKGKLADAEIDVLKTWVTSGAVFPGDTKTSPSSKQKGIDYARGKQFWSFQPASPQKLPVVRRTSWPRQRIDHFILARMEAAGLAPSAEARRSVLIRRVYFDLVGLPPTREEVEQFVQDKRPGAYQRLIDQLLASPRYGERWARMWLDLARYSDRTASWLQKGGQPHLYRDWVIQAFNTDMPYDEFVHRQLATDMMPQTGPADRAALGFLGLSPTYWKELKLPSEIIKVIVADEWEERVDATGRTFLGLTIACARCHDHKFDPIGASDYYAMAGVFASCHPAELPIISDELYEPVAAAKKKVETLQKQLTALKKKKPAPAGEITRLQQQIAELQQTPHYNTPLAKALSEESIQVLRAGKRADQGTRITYKPQPQDLSVFIRGDPNRPGKPAPRQFLRVLSKDQPQPFTQGSGRLELAHAITRQAAPLTARVIANRIWTHHFGQGLVRTPSNFGQMGERPSHSQLLDDLAARLIENNWSIKKLHREILLSATYRQQSRTTPAASNIDPQNRLLHRMNRRRLDVEAWRDAMLYASGQLSVTMGGPSVDVEEKSNRRRTIYGTIHRRDMSKMLQIHDFPDPTSHSPQRTPTVTALQGLYVLNGPLLQSQAAALADRITATKVENSKDKQAVLRQRIFTAYWLTYSREPLPHEVQTGIEFLQSHNAAQRTAAWRQYAHALLGSNEFLFVD